MCAVSYASVAVQRLAVYGVLLLSVECSVHIVVIQRKALDEVESVFVVYETVTVIIHIVGSIDFGLIPPDGILEVLMSVSDCTVEYRHYHARVSGSQTPCILYAYVCSGH